MKQFRSIAIAEINDNASYLSHTCEDPEGEGIYVLIETFKEGFYTIQMDKAPERLRQKIKRGYRYPEGKFEIAKIEEDKVRFYEGMISRKKLMSKSYLLQKGKYVIFASMKFEK